MGNVATTLASWDPSKHPRAAKGAAGGGQFAPLSYDSKSKTGAGYSKAGGDSRVKAAQAALRKQGLTDAQGNPLKLDGKLGPRTTAALKKWQRARGLKADGKITPSLLAALKKGGGKKPMRKANTAAIRARAAKKTTGRKTAGK